MASVSLTDEYLNVIKPRLEAAIDSALDYMAGHLVDTLIEKAQEKVYAAYTPPMYFLQKRRGALVTDGNYVIRHGSGYSVEVENVAVTQSGAAGEINWIESGYRQHKAGARPYMEFGLNEYASTEAETDLITALTLAGF